MAAIGVATAVALGLMVVGVKARYRTMADDSFRRAEELFESGAFTKAHQEFDFFRKEYSSDSRTHRAELAAELSKIAQSIDDELADPIRVIESLDKFAADSRSEASVKDRWPVVLTMAERAARSRLEKANQSLASADLECGETWLGWLHDEQKARADGLETLALAELDQLSVKVRATIAVEGRRRGFMDAAERALAEGTAARFADAFRAYDQLRAGATGTDPVIAATYERLRQSLRAQVHFAPPPQTSETADSVPLLPVEAYTRLSTRTQHRTVSVSGNRPVFARAKDLCFALEPATGAVRWVQRVGYDAPMPEVVSVSGRSAVVVPWFSGAEAMISLCDATTGEAIWSWNAPDLLTGPPAIPSRGNSLFVATLGGAVWQLDLENGTPRGVAELPEPIDSPPTLREDGKGFCVVGARQAVYLFDTSGEQPQCSDLVLFGRRPDTAHCQVMWVPPYVVIFENDLMNRCYVRVLFQESAGLRQVRQLELDGRIWQPPVMDGADIFVMTDRWRIHCFGLDPGNSAVNLYQAASGLKSPPDLRQPTRPHLARITELPFVALSDALYGYRVDRSQGLLREVWTRALHRPDARGVQPIQVVQNLIVAGFQGLSDDGILVQCYDSRQGEPVWETRLASVARDVAVVRSSRGDSQIVARTEASGMFVLSHDQKVLGWKSRRLGQPAASSRMRIADDSGEMVFASDAGTRLCRVSSRDWMKVESLAQSPPISSDLAIFSGDLMIAGQGASGSQFGRWVSFVTADRSIELRELGRAENRVHGVRIPASPPAEQPWQWPPVILEDRHGVGKARSLNGIIASHPSGIVCRAEIRRTEEIDHLLVTEWRKDLPPLAAPSFEFYGQLLCVGTDGRCMLLDANSLRTISDWQSSGPIGGVAADSATAFLVVERTTVRALESRDGKLEADWERKLDAGDWQIACVARDGVSHLFAVNSAGEIVALDPRSGQTVWSYQAPAPLALPPLWVGDELVLSTIDGGIFFVPGPKPTGEKPAADANGGGRS